MELHVPADRYSAQVLRESQISSGKILAGNEPASHPENHEPPASLQESRYRKIAECTGAWIWEIGPEGLFTYSNDAVRHILGYTPEELVGKLHWYDMAGPESREDLRGTLATVFERKEPFRHFTSMCLHKDGRTVFLERSGVPVFDRNNAFSGYCGTDIDVTDQTLAENELQRANRKLNLLSAVTRHDILQLLMALRGFVTLAKPYSEDENFQMFITNEEIIVAKIARELLFTKKYQELGAHATIWQNARDSITEGIRDFNLSKIDLSVEDLAHIEVDADPLFTRVFFHLVENALHHGGTDLHTIRFSAQTSDTHLIISCEDDGIGVDPREKECIFERGYGKGMGLGLFLIREILGITGIHIAETGLRGRGARFELTVPREAWRFVSSADTVHAVP